MHKAAYIGLLALAGASLACAQSVLSGRVVDDTGAPVDGARVMATRAGAGPLESFTSPTGAFRLVLGGEGSYQIVAEHQGYFRLEDHAVTVPSSGAEVTLVLNAQREVFQSVDVGAAPSPIDPAQTARESRLTGTEINNIPYSGTHSLRNAMKLTPGVVQDSAGGVHVHGSAENQVRYTLNGFDITDPVSGRYSTLLAVEGVREMELVSGRGSPEYGRGSGGTLAIHSESGTDRFHYTATNFVPGFDTNHGFHFGHWTPRAVFSGPVKRGRVWFSDSFYGDYNPTFHNGLPSGENSNTYWAAGHLVHVQANLTPVDILYADVLGNFEHENRNGLGVLDPAETTTRYQARQWLVTVKESHTWSNGTLLEAGIAALDTYHRRTPQGSDPYVFSALGRHGNYYVNSREAGQRQQTFVNFYPRSFRRAGRHQLQLGGDAQLNDYGADFTRSPYLLVGTTGALVSETHFVGSGQYSQNNMLSSAYFNDLWRPTERITLSLGFREDWNRSVGKSVWSPRLAIAYSPFAGARLKITGGYGVFHDPTNLSMLSRPRDQLAVTTPFSAAGDPGLPYTSRFRLGTRIGLPVYGNWSAGIERDFGKRIYGRAEFLRKRGRDGYVYAQGEATGEVSIPGYADPVTEGTSLLTNLRRDAYDEVAFTVRQSFGEQYEWFASYVRSRAASNAVLDIRADQIYQVKDNTGRMPWDAPNRFLGWGYMPLPIQKRKIWALSYLAEWRTGFPFPVVRDTGEVVGPVDSHRYPDSFDLNLHIERRFEFHGQRFALRLGMNNVTNSQNAASVYNVIGSPRYLQFVGNEGRHVVVRFRFFGRAKQS